ncbi:SLC25A40 [Symbiodinium natans]|uniref:SLC25A40 protein n=1 Tax=Symbiodinium natans TaxID=878477 RepID=A0A812NFS2_9DINO|nr:SLC25A40 [Symbiodinium natans]
MKLMLPLAMQKIPSEGLRTLTHSFICGGIAGMMAALVTCPIDVIKTLRQKTLTGAERSLTSSMPASESYKDIIRFLVAHPKSSFSGVGPRLLRIPLGMATMMSGMETTKWAFEWRRQSR